MKFLRYWYVGLLGCAVLQAPMAAQESPREWVEPRTGMAFVWVPKGCFTMGTSEKFSPGGDTEWRHLLPKGGVDMTADEKPAHQVCVDGFWIGKHEVRVSDWAMRPADPEVLGDALPVVGVSWGQAQDFAMRLSDGTSLYRLPTEAEWEYACRAGAASEAFPSFDSLVDRAWYEDNEGKQVSPRPVGQLAANAFGVHDMLGNVWEWVADDYQPDGYRQHTLYNPAVLTGGALKVIRGASHRSTHGVVRCANRSSYAADNGMTTIGVRLVRIERGK